MGISLPTAMLGGSLLSGLGGLFGAGMQSSYIEDAIKAEKQMFGVAQGDLAPFMGFGTIAGNRLMEMLGIGGNPGAAGYGSLMKPFNPTMQQLEQTPGYQFALDQGLKSTQNSYAARGLGASGNAMRGAANYAEGLASTTYQQQFENNLQQNNQLYNMLLGPTQLGAGAASAMAGNAMNLGGMLGQNYTGMGNAWAGGINQAFGSLGQGLSAYPMMSAYSNYFNSMSPGMGLSSDVFGAN